MNSRININIIRIISFLFSIISGIFIFLLNYEIKYFGFPDGHITPFQKSMLPFFKSAIFIYILISILFFGLGIFYQKSILSKYIFFITLAIAAITAISIYIILPCYFGVYLNLDNGHGG